ncbi:MAG TPA: hypothetical protein VFR16_09975, partial [Agromyces mariniharenae]|nr:hypothetical protein [Agromyces mariniharenae]
TVLAAVRAIGARLEELEPAALDDEPDAVHQLRTHVRRLREIYGFEGSPIVLNMRVRERRQR